MTGRARSHLDRFAVAAALAVGIASFGWAVLGSAGLVAAADPSSPPTGSSCQDRFPAEGPAGVDLQLGCLVGEIVGHYTGSEAPSEVTPLSAYAPQLAALGLLIAGLAMVSWLARRTLGRRLAPVLPAEWWSCSACRSVNAAGTERCYRCGAGRAADATTLVTAEHPETPQSFGRDRRDEWAVTTRKPPEE